MNIKVIYYNFVKPYLEAYERLYNKLNANLSQIVYVIYLFYFFATIVYVT